MIGRFFHPTCGALMPKRRGNLPILPMKFHPALPKALASLLFAAVFFAAPLARANDHGGAAAPEPMKFIVNLGDPSNGGRFLQVQMVFETAGPDIEHGIVAFRPRIQHALIIALSGQDAGKLMTLQGKKELSADVVEIVNHVLHETEKTGVKDVFFTSFIIQ